MKVAHYWLWRMAAIWGFVGVSQGWQLLVERAWLLSVGVIALGGGFVAGCGGRTGQVLGLLHL